MTRRVTQSVNVGLHRVLSLPVTLALTQLTEELNRFQPDSDLVCLGMTPWVFKPFLESHPEVAWTMLTTLARQMRSAG